MTPKRIARTLLSYAGSAYWRARAAPPVWSFLNRVARRFYQRDPQPLSLPEAEAVRTLRETGIAVAHISEFFPPEVFEALARYAQTRWQSPEVQQLVQTHTEVLTGSRKKADASKKAFLVNLWDPSTGSGQAVEGKPVLDLSHPFIRFSLSEPILRIVNAYLGMFSKFRAWRLEATIPMPQAAGARASQRWHRDEEDQKLVKTFLYLNDVDASSGPFMYVRFSHRGGKWQDLFPMAPPRGSLKMPPNEDDYIPKEDVLISTGRAGTLIFCDTTGLHKGGFAREKPRLMYTSVYTSPASPWPIRYAYPGNAQYRNTEISKSLTPAAGYAIENDPHQREPRFYR